VKVPHGQPEFDKAGEPVRHGDVIRLEHLNTHVNLHSHRNYPSPITGQQEVTGFGHAENGDGHDNWRVEVYCRGIWYVGRKIKLIHVDTNHALHSHAGFYVGEQQEVTCFHDRDANDWWKVTR
jgi:dolichyl-phosphate-mannose--protein O-mannosyl transferase